MTVLDQLEARRVRTNRELHEEPWECSCHFRRETFSELLAENQRAHAMHLQSRDPEACVLGHAIRSELDEHLCLFLGVEDFTDDVHRAIWAACLRLFHRKGGVSEEPLLLALTADATARARVLEISDCHARVADGWVWRLAVILRQRALKRASAEKRASRG